MISIFKQKQRTFLAESNFDIRFKIGRCTTEILELIFRENSVMYKVRLTRIYNNPIIVKLYLNSFGFLFAKSLLNLSRCLLICIQFFFGFYELEPRIIRFFSFSFSYLCLLVIELCFLEEPLALLSTLTDDPLHSC